MSDGSDLTFMMGQFQAHFPVDRMYAKNHMWAQSCAPGCLRFGFSAYAVRLLQDVYFLDLTIDAGMQLALRQEIGSIESKKAESSLYSPVAGQVDQVNQALLDDPSAINLDKYGKGWLFQLFAASDKLLTPDEYLEHLKQAWEVAQRTIKGQANL
jgi:glycine cleavage system H protein